MYSYDYRPPGYESYGYPRSELPDRAFGFPIGQQQLGVEWREQEDGWTGVWRRLGNSNIFDARWTMPGAQDITAVLTINIFDSNVQVLRRNSSDGNDCNYTGTIAADGRTVTGTYLCTRGGGSWRATITF